MLVCVLIDWLYPENMETDLAEWASNVKVKGNARRSHGVHMLFACNKIERCRIVYIVMSTLFDYVSIAS